MASVSWEKLRFTADTCVEILPATLIAGAMTTAGAICCWPLAAAATIPAALAFRDAYRSVRDSRRWAVTRWLVAERRWQLAQASVSAGQLEGNEHPLIVEGTVVERAPR